MSTQNLIESAQIENLLHDQEPLVSVITLCYNHSKFVLEALESVRQQSYKNIQWIIIDDCSSDNSVDLIQEWIEKHRVNCHFIVHVSNHGVLKTVNEAISLTRGKYIAYAPSDDIWVLDKLEHQVAQMEKLSEEVAVLYSDSYRIDPNGNKIDKLFIEACCRNFSSIPTGNIFQDLLRGNFIQGSTTLIRRNCIDKVGLYDENLVYEDWDMWLRISSHYHFFFSNKISVYYRVVPNSLTHVFFLSKNIPAALTCYNMFMKYYDDSKVRAYYKQDTADQLHICAYDLNELRYKKRSNCLYKAWRYDFRKKTFYLWLFASLKVIPQNWEHNISTFLASSIKYKIRTIILWIIHFLPQQLAQRLHANLRTIKKRIKQVYRR